MVKDAEERPARVPEYAGAPEKRGALLVNDSNKPEMSAGLGKDSLENHVSSMSDCCCSSNRQAAVMHVSTDGRTMSFCCLI